MRQDSILLALDRIHESENVARAACTLWAPGWGALFPHCASVAFWLTDCCMALCGLLFRFCFTLPYQSWGDTMLSSLLAFPIVHELTDQLTTDGAVFGFVLVRVVYFLVFCRFVCFWFLVSAFCLTRWQLNVSIQFSSLLYHIVIMATANVATALIRWICRMQLSFRLDKRPGEAIWRWTEKIFLFWQRRSVSYWHPSKLAFQTWVKWIQVILCLLFEQFSLV